MIKLSQEIIACIILPIAALVYCCVYSIGESVDTAVVVGVLITSIGYSVLSVYYLLDFKKRFVFTFDNFAYYF